MKRNCFKMMVLLLVGLLLLNLTGCVHTPEDPGTSAPPVNLNFPAVTEEQAAAVRQARQTPMLPVQSAWVLGIRWYEYDENNALTRIDTYEKGSVCYCIEYKKILSGTSFTEMTRYVWENEYQPFYHVITLDAQGRCAQVVRVNTDPLRPSGDAEPVTYLFEYDAQGRLIRWTDSEGETQYIYDENGDVKEKIRWNGYAKEYNTKVHTVYERDAAGQPVRVHAETYNAKTGERTKTTDTGYAIEYINDANGRLTGLNRYETGSGRLMQKITYVYDDSGKLIGFTESVGRDEPIPGMEWLKLNDDLRGDTDIIWRTPEAYHAQAEEAE